MVTKHKGIDKIVHVVNGRERFDVIVSESDGRVRFERDGVRHKDVYACLNGTPAPHNPSICG